jgi:hypothetical protein
MGLLQSSRNSEAGVALPCAIKGAAMSGIEYREWQKAYREAVLEVDLGKLPARIFDRKRRSLDVLEHYGQLQTEIANGKP